MNFEQNFLPKNEIKKNEDTTESNENLPENSPEKFQNEMQSIENDELSSVEEKSEKKSRFKKAICAITAGIILLNVTPAFAQEKGEQVDETQKIEFKIQKLQEQQSELERFHGPERFEKLESYLDSFNIDGLELGEAKHKRRSTPEQFGLYLNGEYLGDLFPSTEGGFSSPSAFTESDFTEKISKILEKNGISQSEEITYTKSESTEALDVNISTNEKADETLKKFGGYIDKEKNNMYPTSDKNIVFGYDDKTKEIKISGVDTDTIMIILTDFDGNKEALVYDCNAKEIIDESF